MRLSTRRALTFLTLMMPAITLEALELWTDSNLGLKLSAQGEMPYLARTLFAAADAGIALAAIALIALAVSGPAWAFGVAAAGGALSQAADDASRAVMPWCCTSFATYAAACYLLLVHRSIASMPLAWAAFLSYSISLGCAFAVQNDRFSTGLSRFRPAWVFAGAALLHYLLIIPALLLPGSQLVLPIAPLILPVAVWAAWRVDPLVATQGRAERGAAEQGDEADEAR